MFVTIASGERAGHRKAGQGLALLNGKFFSEMCQKSVDFIAGRVDLLDIYWTLSGHLLDTYWTTTGHLLDTHWGARGFSRYGVN